MQIPGYLQAAGEIRAAGVDEVIVYCVNDGAVMQAWGKDQGIEKSEGLITFMGDPSGALTEALDIQLDHPGPNSVGIIGRSKRTAMYLVDGVVKAFNVAEKDDDPAGDNFPESTCAPAMLAAISPFKVEL